MKREHMPIQVLLESLNGKVNENIYGQFIEQALNCINGGIYDPESNLADKNGIRKDVLEKIKIALDEWNIWDYIADETYGLLPIYCWRDALWVAGILNLLVENPMIGIANMAQMVNVLAPIVTQENGSWFQTIAYPLRLYRKTMTGERISLKYNSPQINTKEIKPFNALSISAVKNDDRTIRIALVNRDFSNDYTISLDYNKFAVNKTAEMKVLTGDSPKAVCSLTECCVHELSEHITVDNILLRAGSINLITIPQQN